MIREFFLSIPLKTKSRLTDIRQQRVRFVVLGVTLLFTVGYAQPPDTMWTRTYFGASNALSIEPTPDGGYIIAQWVDFPYDASLLKLDSLGNVQWEHSYGTEGTFEEFGEVKPCPAGGFIAVGERFGYPTYNDPETYVVRTNENGDTLWTRTVNIQNRDFLGSVEVADNGDFICVGRAGYIGATSDSGDVLIMRYSDAGELLWVTRYRGEFSSIASDVVCSGPDRFIVGGQTGRFWEDDETRAYVLMIDGNGDTLWTRTYGLDVHSLCQHLVTTGDGGFAFTGETTVEPVDGSDMIVMRGDSAGNLLWGDRFGHGQGRAIQRLPDSGFAVFHSTGQLPEAGSDYGLQRLTLAGDTVWTARYGTPADDYITTGQVSPDNGFLMLGLNSGGVYLVRTLPLPLVAFDPSTAVPKSTILLSAYPNPFNSATTISYTLSKRLMVKLTVYDILGRQIQSSISAWLSPGSHYILFNAEELASGTYFLQLDAGKEVNTLKLILQR